MFISNTGGTLTNVTTNTTFVGSGEIRANVPSTTAGNYTLYVFNPSGSAAIYYSGIAFEPYPLWNTTSVTFGGTTISGNVATYVTSTAGIQPITFSLAAGNTLPSGLTLYSNGAILGTITQSNSTQTYYANIVATDLYNEATTSNISLTVNLTDPSFNSTTLLLNGETNTNTYIQDTSNNNFALTVNGSATPNRFSPLWGNGYYGYNFSSGYLSYTQPAAFTGDFTIEGWVNPSSLGTYNMIWASSSPNHYFCLLQGGTSSVFGLNAYNSSVSISSSANVTSINQWHHIAFVRISGVLYFYIDGVQTGSGTFTGTIGSSGTATIGMSTNYSGTDYFNGFLSNFRIVNGVGVYTNNFTVPTGPLTITQLAGTNITAITSGQTQLLTAQNNNFSDNSTNASTFTPTGTIKVVSNQPFGALPSGVQNYGSSLFDGSTGYLSAPSGAGALGTNPFTIEFWYYGIANGNAYATVVSKNVTGSPSSGTWSFGINFNGTPSVWFAYYTTGFVDVQTSQAVSNQQWHHIAATRNGTVLNLYLDGVLTQTATLPSNFSFGPSSDPTLIGYNSRNNAYINGYISNLRIVNGTAVYTANFTPPTAPLTAIANTALLTLQNKNGANNNTFYDDSTNNFPITRTGTPTQGTFTPFSQTGWSTFMGYGAYGYMNVPANTGYDITTGDFTVEFWANFSTWNTMQSSGMSIVSNWTGSSGWLISWNGGVGASLEWYTWNAGAVVSAFTTTGIVAGTDIQIGQWNHFTVMQKTGTLYFFLNGVMKYSVTAGASVPAGNALYFGVYAQNFTYAGNPYFYLSNLRIVKGTAVYTTTNFTPPISPLTAVSGTTLLICQNNRHLDNSSINAVITPTSSGTYPSIQAFSPFAPGVLYSSANNGGSMYFNGSTDYITTTSTVNIGTNNFTCEAWIYLTSTAVSSPGILSATTDGGIQLGIYGTNGIGIASRNVGWIFYYNSSSIVPLNAWTHVVWTRGGTGTNQTSIFINGTRVVNGTASSNFGNYTLSVGTVSGYYFTGYISNLKFTNGTDLYGYGNTTIPIPTSPPTPTANTSLLLLGTNTGVQDATGKNDIITYGSAKTQANTVKYGTGAMYFDGSTAYVTMSTASNQNLVLGTGSFTIEFWAYIATSSLTANFLDFRATTTNGIYPTLLLNSGALNYYVNGSTVITGSSPSISTWHHIALVRNSGTTKLYLDGTATGSAYTDSNSYLVGSAIAIGSSSYTLGSSYFNGYIDDLRITKGVARYTANFTPPASAFLTL